MRTLGLALACCALYACTGHSDTLSAFPDDSLYQLLVGEFAMARGEREQALELYLAQAERTDDAQVAQQAAQLAYSLGRSDEAHRATRIWLRAAAAAGQDAPEAHMTLAYLLLERGAAQEGQRQLEAALATGARFDLARLARQLRIGSARGRQATARALSALSLPDNQPQLEYSRRHGIALMLEAEGQLEAALAQFERARQAFPDTVVQWVRDDWRLRDEFRLLARLGRPQAILRRQRQLAAAAPELPSLRWQLIAELRRQGQLQAALDDVRSWLREQPQEPSLLLQAALLGMALGHRAEAGQCLRQLADIPGHQAVAQHYLGWLAAQEGHAAKASAWRRQAGAAKRPMTGLRLLAPLLERTEDIAEYRALLRQLRTTQPKLALRLYQLEVRLLHNQYRWRESAAVLDNALAQFPQDSYLAYLRALAAIEDGQDTDGIQRLRTLLALSPEDATLQNALGYSLADHGIELEEALTLIQRALRQQPTDASTIDSMGWVLYRLGRMDAALNHLRRALRLREADSEITAHLGEVLWTLGQYKEARELWGRTLAVEPENPLLLRTMQRLDSKAAGS